MIVHRASSNESLALDAQSPLGAGGEAQVLPVIGDESLAAKIYREPRFLNGAKLGAMIGNPPDYPAGGHALIAWPIDLLIDSENRIIGFLMPRVKQMRPLIDFYNPPRRNRICPRFNYFYLHRMAQNLAIAFKVLHDRGYVIADVNQLNVLGNERALVTLVDADSFQVTDATGEVFRCGVGTPEFTPPELSGKSFAQINRSPEHDRFGLAVLIFQLLMEGVHPFDGIYRGAGDPPPREQRIASGHFPYGSSNGIPYAPLPMGLPFSVIDPDLRALIEQCFSDGHKAPSKRPEAVAWKTALSAAQGRLVSCGVKPAHYYGRHLTSCPWCERSVLLGGRDPFVAAGSPSDRTTPAQSDMDLELLRAALQGLPARPVVTATRASRSSASTKPRAQLAIPYLIGPTSLAAASMGAFVWLLALSVGPAGSLTSWLDFLSIAADSLAILFGIRGIRKARGRRDAVLSAFGIWLGLMILIPSGLSIGWRLWRQPAMDVLTSSAQPPPTTETTLTFRLADVALAPAPKTMVSAAPTTMPETLPLPTVAQAPEIMETTKPTTSPAAVALPAAAPDPVTTKRPGSTTGAAAIALSLVGPAAVSPPASKVPPARMVFTNTIGMKFTHIEPGEFFMGSPATEDGRFGSETQHKVKLTKPFLLGTHHVTRGQFAAFAKDSGFRTDAEKDGWSLAWDGAVFGKVDGASWQKPGFEQTDDHPVVEVSWNDAQAFCNWLSHKEGKSYRLPTEAEWEYAARAGTRTAYFWGDSPDGGRGFANCADLTAKGKFPNQEPMFNWRDGFVFTSPVESFKPNPWGLYDMSGNAWEWCGDNYGPYGDGDAVDPKGPVRGDTRCVVRGGSWYSFVRYCRVACRFVVAPGSRRSEIGFRVCLEADLETPQKPGTRPTTEAAADAAPAARMIPPALPAAAKPSPAPALPEAPQAIARRRPEQQAAKNFTNTVGMKFTRIEPGEFLMGSPAGEVGRFDDETQHKVRLTKPFFLGTYHVTRGQFAAFVKDAAYRTDGERAGDDKSWQKPGFDQTDDHPRVEVSWNDAQAFCRWLSNKEGKTYRLPTEAEWEYAARAGTHTAYFWGDDAGAGRDFANYGGLAIQRKFNCTSPVGSFKPNPWGLYDMIGNAYDWCSDLFGTYGADVVDPTGPAPVPTLSSRTLRGGSWSEDPRLCRSAFRRLWLPNARLGVVGFRIALDF